MSNQIQATGAVKIRSLTGVLTGSSGVVSSVPLGAANGVATLDNLGKVPLSQLPASVVTYLGTWNASTNTPTLVNGVGDVGDLYICNVAGTVNFGAGPITFAVGDWVIYSGTTWQKSSGASGTVTSVSVTESGDALTITGSPITTSGTINIGFTGTSGQYVNGAGGLTTFPSLTGFVPYTGATSDLNLGLHDLKTSKLWLYDQVEDGYASINYSDEALNFKNSDNETIFYVEPEFAQFHKTPLIQSNLWTSLLTATRDHYLPNTSGTLALLSDIPSLSGYIQGSGTTNYLPKFTASGTIGNSIISEVGGTNININGTLSAKGLVISGASSGYPQAIISGTGNSAMYIQAPSTSYTSELLLWAGIGSQYGMVQYNNTSNYLSFYTNSIAYARLFSNGNFAIGTTLANNGFKLEVEGNSKISGSLTLGSTISNGTYTYSLPSATGTIALTSDIPSLAGYVPTSRTISTTAPLSGGGDLTANRTLTISQATTSTNGYLSSTDWNIFNGKQAALTNPVTGTGTSGYHTKWTGTNTVNNSLIYDNGTSIGINTTSLTYPVNITGTTVSIRGQDGGTPRQLTVTSGGGTLVSLTAQGYGANYGTDLGFYTATTSGVNANPSLYLTSSGYALIGTATSTGVGSGRLQVSGTATTAQFLLTNTGGHTALYTTGTDAYVTRGTGGIMAFGIAPQDGSAFTEHLRITSGGNVGIGTSSPSSKLHIYNSGADVFNTLETTGGFSAYNRNKNGNRSWVSGIDGTSSSWIVLDETASSVRMAITSGGTTLFGGTTFATISSAILGATNSSQTSKNWSFGPNVAGDFVVYHNSGSPSFGVYLSYGGVAWISNSDERLKTDLIPIEDAINKVCFLRSVIGRYNSDKIGTKRTFLIAQDLQKVLPEVVNVDSETGNLGVSYSEVIPLLVAAIKEQQAQIEAQQTIISNLESRMLTLENK